MLTAAKYSVSWLYREGNEVVRRTLYHSTLPPCIEAARIFGNHPFASEIEVHEVDTGNAIEWRSSAPWIVLTKAEE